jgi:hypothetical protein
LELGLSEGEMDCIELAVSYTFLYVNAGDNSHLRRRFLDLVMKSLVAGIVGSVRDGLWRRILGRSRRNMDVLKAHVLKKNCVKEHKVCEEMEQVALQFHLRVRQRWNL